MLSYEELTEMAKAAGKKLRVRTPRNLRVRALLKSCPSYWAAHNHSRKQDPHYGRICVIDAVLSIPREQAEMIMLHEVLHYKIHNHTERFWYVQDGFVPIAEYDALVSRLNLIAKLSTRTASLLRTYT